MKRRMMEGIAALAVGAAWLFGGPASATREFSAKAQSLPEMAEAIHKAGVSTRILFITAHPDDEWPSLLTYLSHGLGADVALLTLTRGQGGQNAIGPEQDGELGVIRTEELLAAGKYYGVHQYFTRAPDFGFSKSAEQTLQIWGQVPLEDMVRVIRTYRPDIVINGWGGTHWGHGNHQASGILTPQAVADAADPKMFPEQLAEGLTPWKVTLDLRMGSGSGNGAVELPVNDVSPLWGKSYVEMGMEGHAQHRSQGTPLFFNSPFFRRPIYLVKETMKGEEAGGFDAALLAEPITALASIAPQDEAAMKSALGAAQEDLAAAEKSALALDRVGAAKLLANAGKRIEAERERLGQEPGSEGAAAAWELGQVQKKIDEALTLDIALAINTQADRHELVAGEDFTVDVDIPEAGAVPVKWSVDDQSLQVPSGWKATLENAKGESGSYQFRVTLPIDAKAPQSPEDAILPFPPPLVELKLMTKVDGYSFAMEQPVKSMQAATTGLETYPLELVPAVTLTVDPRQVMVPEKRLGEPVRLLARVRYHGTAPASVTPGMDAPEGWSVNSAPKLEYKNGGDQLIQFLVTPPAAAKPGAYELQPYAKSGGETFRTSLQSIPTLPTRDWSEPDDAKVHVLSLNVPAGLHIGYVAADNDPLPEVIRQLGIRVDLLDEVALAFGDLSQYDAIVVGIRAYELRPDLPRANERLLKYVKNGGSLVVQYQRDYAWNKLLPGPFPAKMAQQGVRVTDWRSPVEFLAPENPLLNTPNKITKKDFEGWVQERGIYFWSTFGPPYVGVLGLTDFGEKQTNGGLVYARDGKGVYMYTGLSFFRELPAGVPGAYRLFVNLLSQTPHAGEDK
ncbi:MAG TPA: PIG-L family deacetylase [Candidatus Acidoferrum sp.]|nr:PIG-L family deacetylase [Candidatus Acidoferrum sp.]